MARTPTTPAAKKPAPKRPPRAATRKPARPKGLAQGRWLGDFPKLSAAEKRLLECCARGEPWKPVGWNGERPEEGAEANTIRAELIRFLALGGDDVHPVHEAGVMVRGAWVVGTLDLQHCHVTVLLSLQRCQLVEAPIFLAACIPDIVLRGSGLPGISADGSKVAGSVFLDQGLTAAGEVRWLGAEIGGVFVCTGSKFTNAGGHALSADRMKVTGSVFLDHGFVATGEVRLLGAEIGSVLVCTGGNFTNAGGHALSADSSEVVDSVYLDRGFFATGEVRFPGAKIGGSLTCVKGTFNNPGGSALRVDKVHVTGSVHLREAKIDGAIRFPAARIGTLEDDEFCWSAGGSYLDGLRYERIAGKSDAETRIRWLERQRPDQLNSDDWSPQPWEQLIKVLRDMGHPLEATKVAIAKQERMRRAGKVGGPSAQFMHELYGLVAGYGYRPIYTVGWMLAFWLVAGIYFYFGAQFGYIGPGTPLLNSPDLSAQIEATCGHRFEVGKVIWTSCPAMPAEYTTFQPFMYSLDLILPLVDLQQESDWAPIVEDPPGNTLGFGAFLRWLMWAEILFGWAMSLMLVAVLGKLVNKD